MYINPDDFAKLPESLQITYEGTNYWIYFSTDSPVCFLCKTEGHLAKQCKNDTEHTAPNVQSLPVKKYPSREVEFPALGVNTCKTKHTETASTPSDTTTVSDGKITMPISADSQSNGETLQTREDLVTTSPIIEIQEVQNPTNSNSQQGSNHSDSGTVVKTTGVKRPISSSDSALETNHGNRDSDSDDSTINLENSAAETLQSNKSKTRHSKYL